MSVGSTTGTTAGSGASRAQDHPALEWLAKAGMAVYGVMYVVVGWLALQLAFGDSQGQASGQGALHELAGQTFGAVVLWVACAGFVALTVWMGLEAAVGHRDREGVKRLAGRAASAGRAVVFAVLAVLAFQTVTGSAGGGSSKDSYTAELMRMPLGPALVVGVGAGIAAVGVFGVYKGVSDKWERELQPEGRTGQIGTALRVLARTGHVSHGIAFIVIGGLFGWAGVSHDAQESGGLDQALLTLRDAPFGQVLLVAVATGLVCYGVFNVAKAWYLRAR